MGNIHSHPGLHTGHGLDTLARVLGERRKKVKVACAGSVSISPFFQGKTINPAGRFLCPAHSLSVEFLCLASIMDVGSRNAEETEEEEQKPFQPEKEASRP